MLSKEQKILDILKEKEMHGYEIVVKLSEDSKDSFHCKMGNLYPILRSLEKRRLLKSYEIPKNGKGRIYYKRTRKQGGDSNEK